MKLKLKEDLVTKQGIYPKDTWLESYNITNEKDYIFIDTPKGNSDWLKRINKNLVKEWERTTT